MVQRKLSARNHSRRKFNNRLIMPNESIFSKKKHLMHGGDEFVPPFYDIESIANQSNQNIPNSIDKNILSSVAGRRRRKSKSRIIKLSAHGKRKSSRRHSRRSKKKFSHGRKRSRRLRSRQSKKITAHGKRSFGYRKNLASEMWYPHGRSFGHRKNLTSEMWYPHGRRISRSTKRLHSRKRQIRKPSTHVIAHGRRSFGYRKNLASEMWYPHGKRHSRRSRRHHSRRHLSHSRRSRRHHSRRHLSHSRRSRRHHSKRSRRSTTRMIAHGKRSFGYRKNLASEMWYPHGKKHHSMSLRRDQLINPRNIRRKTRVVANKLQSPFARHSRRRRSRKSRRSKKISSHGRRRTRKSRRRRSRVIKSLNQGRRKSRKSKPSRLKKKMLSKTPHILNRLEAHGYNFDSYIKERSKILNSHKKKTSKRKKSNVMANNLHHLKSHKSAISGLLLHSGSIRSRKTKLSKLDKLNYIKNKLDNEQNSQNINHHLKIFTTDPKTKKGLIEEIWNRTWLYKVFLNSKSKGEIVKLYNSVKHLPIRPRNILGLVSFLAKKENLKQIDIRNKYHDKDSDRFRHNLEKAYDKLMK